MTDKEFQNTTIKEYIELIKDGTNTEKLNSINAWLSAKVCSPESGDDLHLLKMQKELILFTAKHFKAQIEQDETKEALYFAKIEELTNAIKIKLQNVGEIKDPYVSFLDWLLSLKKYFGSDIDRNNDLIELVEATNQMMKFIENQDKQIEKMRDKK